jgi:hypothetical protein
MKVYDKSILKNVRKRKGNEEANLQKACVTWFRLSFPKVAKLLVSIPNGAHLAGNGARQWNSLKSQGAVEGASDLILFIASGDYHGLCIEMKTTAKSSRQSENQKDFETAVVNQNFGYVMPRTFNEFRKTVMLYLQEGKILGE